MLTAKEVDEFLKSLVAPTNGKAEATQENPNEPINGFIVYKDFTGLTIVNRQKQLWDQLRERFREDASQIGMIFTFTPYEYEEMFAEESA